VQVFCGSTTSRVVPATSAINFFTLQGNIKPPFEM